MSDVLYPDLPGIDINVGKIPAFSTKIQRAVSGHEARCAFQAYPMWTFSLSYNVLRAGAERELQKLVGFFLARRGAYDSFLFIDPDDSVATDQAFGTGNGSATQFQLQRTFGEGSGALFAEPVHNPSTLTAIKIAGTLTASYTLGSAGLITFASPPANGAALTWSGTYAYRCRFVRDDQEVTRFMQDLWEAGKVELLGSLLNKV